MDGLWWIWVMVVWVVLGFVLFGGGVICGFFNVLCILSLNFMVGMVDCCFSLLMNCLINVLFELMFFVGLRLGSYWWFISVSIYEMFCIWYLNVFVVWLNCVVSFLYIVFLMYDWFVCLFLSILRYLLIDEWSLLCVYGWLLVFVEMLLDKKDLGVGVDMKVGFGSLILILWDKRLIWFLL